MTKTSTKPEQKSLFNGLTFMANMIGYTYKNTTKEKNTMSKVKQYIETSVENAS
jgi:hypothetical protein